MAPQSWLLCGGLWEVAGGVPLEFGYQRKRILFTHPCYLYDHYHGHYNDHADDVSTDTHANAIANTGL